MNVPVELHNIFKSVTAAQGQNMTDVLMDYIESYIAKYAPKQKGRRQVSERAVFYCRISTTDQNATPQLLDLRQVTTQRVLEVVQGYTDPARRDL